MAINLPLALAAIILVPYIDFSGGYRASVVVGDITAGLKRNNIKHGCPVSTLMTYLEKRHAEPFKDHDGPYIFGWMGSSDVRTLGNMVNVRFQISKQNTVESYSFEPADVAPTSWSKPQAGT